MDILISLSKPYKILTAAERAAFHRWFGKSVVTDANGDPKRVYHGTVSDFRAFGKEFLGTGIDAYGIGFYFTDRSDHANAYANRKIEGEAQPDYTGGNVMPVYLKIVRPINFDKQPRITYKQVYDTVWALGAEKVRKFLGDNVVDLSGASASKFRAELRDYLESYVGMDMLDAGNMMYNDFFDHDGDQSKFSAAFAAATKRDGVVLKRGDDHIYVVFSPTQIKSAIGNAGTFRPRTADLRA